MSDKDVVSLRITEHEKEYLKNIAAKFDIQKRGSTDISYAKALKILLDYCLHNDINPSQTNDNELQEMRKMIEQIHASIPHLMYHNNLQSIVLLSKYTDADLTAVKQKTIQYLNENFSGFQNVSYREIKIKINGVGLKTIPMEQGESLWK